MDFNGRFKKKGQNFKPPNTSVIRTSLLLGQGTDDYS